MPKASTPSFPLNGLFAVNKVPGLPSALDLPCSAHGRPSNQPSGPTSMHLLESLKHLFKESPLFIDPNAVVDKKQKKRRGGAVKMGQGGTLDPLADGVLGEL